MSRDYEGEWPPYVPVAERRRKAARIAERLHRKGQVLAPVAISGRAIATTAWGKAWCDNMESYRDYESRLPRGRTYLRNGSVLDLQIAPGEVTALVNGSELYRITVRIGRLPVTAWRRICADCAGRIDSLVELLQARFSKAVMERLCRQQGGLFPRPSEIRFTCSCPDNASLCKHVAAVLYGVGARLDHKPELLFRLRAVDEAELVAGIGTDLPMAKAVPAAGRVLEEDQVAALFGLDIDTAGAPGAVRQPGKPAASRVRSPPAVPKATPRAAKPGEAGAKKVAGKQTPTAPRKGATKIGPAAAPSTVKPSAARSPKAGRPRAVVHGGGTPVAASDQPAGSRRRSIAPRPVSKSKRP
ncbi:SWIM zinc finger family protein [Siccirubricoccus sp. G192]|uniref:SWIM zinc finger family protein n=1 Tax=Siccirubricoccus sp. G192 TaxID=2849651 RepID=UPI001C2C81EB|nr:SWIM zinc finger family protein [Siccirubricoccus sp. G192]MBV1800453.1 SWIM zinc finger family protein [Siccirubricoccus sp. G192]